MIHLMRNQRNTMAPVTVGAAGFKLDIQTA